MMDFILYELAPIVFNMSVTASVVIGFVLLARFLLKRTPKIFSYALWTVVLFRLLCPVSVSSGASLLGVFDAPVKETASRMSVVQYVQLDSGPIAPPSFPDSRETNGRPISQEPVQVSADSSKQISLFVSGVYLAGIFGMLGYGATSFVRLRRRLVGAIPLYENIFLADHIDTPFVLGILRPTIYLPSSLSPQEQGYILLHEQHHIRRLDHVTRILAFLALCLHWFNPMVWAAFVLSGKDMEMSCDEAVVKKLGAEIRADYAASLLRLATGRRVITGTPLAFGEGETKSRIKNLLTWKKPKRRVLLAAVAACAAVLVACGVNPLKEDMPPPTASALTGQYASMEDFAEQTMAAAETGTIPYCQTGGGTARAAVLDTKLAWLDKQGELEGLAPEGTLEAWTFHYLVKIDADASEVLLVGGMYKQGRYYDLEGQGGHTIVALRYPDGSYDILYDQIVNDNMDFYGYHNNEEEALYDWYVTAKGLDLPLYVKGSVHRFDGDGWYLYIPIGVWERAADDAWQWTSAYGTGATLTVERLTGSLKDSTAEAQAQNGVPVDTDGQVWEYHNAGVTRYDYFTEVADGCWRVTIQWTDARITDYPYIAMEPDTLRFMAEGFTLDSRITG